MYHLRRDFFVSFLLFLLSQKKKQEKPDGKRKKKKGSAVSLGVLEKRLFRIKCSARFSSLRRDCGMRTPSANPTAPDLLVYLDGGQRSFVLYAPRGLQKLIVSGGRLPSTRRENCNGCQHISSVIYSLIAVRVAGFDCVADDHWSPLHYYR